MTHLVLTTVGGDPAGTVRLEHDQNPTVGPQEVLVAVEGAPVNPADLLFMLGWFGVYPQVPNALGAEGVGRVTKAGSGVDPSLVGRRVIILPTFVHGTWADQVVVPVGKVVPVTENADSSQLAMLAVNPATAYSLLHDYVELKPGDWIGVGLANSGVGQNVIQLAKRSGLKVLGIVRREEAAKQVEALGADRVVIEGEGLSDRITAALGAAKLRILFDGGSPELGQLVGAVENGGTVVAYSAVTGQALAMPFPDLIYRRISLRSFYILGWIENTPRTELERIYGELAQLVADGVLSSRVEATYPLDRYGEALAHAGRPERAGKVLFVPEQKA
jgi:NADPH:quinone reductase-like Zn-dependent oxidoreductase